MTSLAIIQLDDYDRELIQIGLDAAFAELNLAEVIKPSEKILVKPNMLSGVDAQRAVTAHPEVFRALCSSLRDLGADLCFGDSPAIDLPEKAAQTSGLLDMARSIDVPLADFVNSVETAMPEGRIMRKMPLAKGVAESDGLVSLGKLKTHALTGMTGAIKNQFGVIPGQRKATFHVAYPILEDFCQMLVDINLYLKPRLYVMDAIVAMEGNGPRNGSPRKIGVILLSCDPVAIDAAGSLLMGIDPASVPTSRLAEKAGLGSLDLAAVDACLIRPAGGQNRIQRGNAKELLIDLQVRDFVKGRIARNIFTRTISMSAPLYKRRIMRRPSIESETCTRCGLCVKACPVRPGVITQINRGVVPIFDYMRCIRCYCCQETCPTGAIEVHVTPVGRLLGL